MGDSKETFFDFKAQTGLVTSFAEDYLRQYYDPDRGVSEDEQAIYSFIKRIAPQLTGTESCLEIGCGPTLHHAIMLSPYIGTLDMADYLEENLAFIDHWRNKTSKAWDWTCFTQFCIEEDRSSDAPNTGQKAHDLIEHRENLTRSKIKSLRTVDILSSKPLGTEAQQYDLVATFYCTEEVALTVPAWKSAVSAVCSTVKNGGHLLITCLEDTNFYHLKDADGKVHTLPCARVKAQDLHDVLLEQNFVVGTDSLQVVRTPGQSGEGIPGVLMGFIQKKF